MTAFLAGLAVGVGATCAGSLAVVVWLIRHAPRIEHEQWPAESDGLTR